MPSDVADDLTARLTSIGMSPADRKNAVAVVSLVAAGFQPDSRTAARAARALGDRDVEPSEWPRIVDVLEEAGIVATVSRRGKRIVLPAAAG